LRNQREIYYDRKFDAALAATVEATAEATSNKIAASSAPLMPPPGGEEGAPMEGEPEAGMGGEEFAAEPGMDGAPPEEEVEDDGPGVLATRLHADGGQHDLLYVDGGPSTTGTVGHLRMKGREVFRHAVVNLTGVLNEVLADMQLSGDSIDWVVPHQANARILDATARKLGIAPEKVVVTVDQHANTSAASVPLAFDVARKDGRIKQGDLVMFEAMGGGFTWGASLVRM